MQSSTHRCGHGCINRRPAACKGTPYGWRAGPHTVKAKNTAAEGKCDTFGNLAFKSKSKAYLPAEDDVEALSSVSPQSLKHLEELILEEHERRMRVEADTEHLKQIKETNTGHLFTHDRVVEHRRGQYADPSEEQLNELLREIRDIVRRPLHQINMDLLIRIIRRQEILQRKREYDASKLYTIESIAEEYAKAEEQLQHQQTGLGNALRS